MKNILKKIEEREKKVGVVYPVHCIYLKEFIIELIEKLDNDLSELTEKLEILEDQIKEIRENL